MMRLTESNSNSNSNNNNDETITNNNNKDTTNQEWHDALDQIPQSQSLEVFVSDVAVRDELRQSVDEPYYQGDPTYQQQQSFHQKQQQQQQQPKQYELIMTGKEIKESLANDWHLFYTQNNLVGDPLGHKEQFKALAKEYIVNATCEMKTLQDNWRNKKLSSNSDPHGLSKVSHLIDGCWETAEKAHNKTTNTTHGGNIRLWTARGDKWSKGRKVNWEEITWKETPKQSRDWRDKIGGTIRSVKIQLWRDLRPVDDNDDDSSDDSHVADDLVTMLETLDVQHQPTVRKKVLQKLKQKLSRKRARQKQTANENDKDDKAIRKRHESAKGGTNDDNIIMKKQSLTAAATQTSLKSPGTTMVVEQEALWQSLELATQNLCTIVLVFETMSPEPVQTAIREIETAVANLQMMLRDRNPQQQQPPPRKKRRFDNEKDHGEFVVALEDSDGDDDSPRQDMERPNGGKDTENRNDQDTITTSQNAVAGIDSGSNSSKQLSRTTAAATTATATTTTAANDDTVLKPSHQPTEKDVLFGRGELANTHKGNARFRAKRDELWPRHRAAGRFQRIDVARELMQYVRNGGGEFLKKSPDDGLWRVAPEKEALDKCASALREKIKTNSNTYGEEEAGLKEEAEQEVEKLIPEYEKVQDELDHLRQHKRASGFKSNADWAIVICLIQAGAEEKLTEFLKHLEDDYRKRNLNIEFCLETYLDEDGKIREDAKKMARKFLQVNRKKILNVIYHGLCKHWKKWNEKHSLKASRIFAKAIKETFKLYRLENLLVYALPLDLFQSLLVICDDQKSGPVGMPWRTVFMLDKDSDFARMYPDEQKRFKQYFEQYEGYKGKKGADSSSMSKNLYRILYSDTIGFRESETGRFKNEYKYFELLAMPYKVPGSAIGDGDEEGFVESLEAIAGPFRELALTS